MENFGVGSANPSLKFIEDARVNRGYGRIGGRDEIALLFKIDGLDIEYLRVSGTIRSVRSISSTLSSRLTSSQSSKLLRKIRILRFYTFYP